MLHFLRRFGTTTAAQALPGRLVPVDGFASHCNTPMDHWSVTQSDLKELRTEIADAIDKGGIRPTALDPFDPFDRTYGPCIHTVVAQFIKPITYMAGCQSWANHLNGRQGLVRERVRYLTAWGHATWSLKFLRLDHNLKWTNTLVY